MELFGAHQPRCVLVVKVNGHTLYAHLEEHESAKAFIRYLQSEGLTFSFDEVTEDGATAALPWRLPEKDAEIHARCGDLLVTKENELKLFFGDARGIFTRIGGIGNLNTEKREAVFGKGAFTAQLSLEWDE